MATTKFEKPVGSETFELQQQVSSLNTKVGNVGNTDLQTQVTTLGSTKVNTSDIVNTLNNTATNKPLSAAQGKALNDSLTTLNSNIGNLDAALNGNSLRFLGTLGENVLTAAQNCAIGLTFYRNSNNPTNCPSEMNWGAYLFMKSDSTKVSIFCWDNSHFACLYSLDPTTATSITWNIVK